MVFTQVGLREGPTSWERLAHWGAPPADRIWTGAYWALLTSVFVHVAPLHLAFNVYWLWILGGLLERVIGPLRWLGIFVAAAIVSSGFQLGASGVTGIGLSGVIYAFFGFMWAARRRCPPFERVLTTRTIQLFLIWLAACVVATWAGIWNVGNAAHASGLLFGLASGAAFRAPRTGRAPATVAAGTLVAMALVPLFWCPWRFEWVAAKAYAAHAREDYRSAVDWYVRAKEFRRAEEPQRKAWVLENLALAYRSLGDRGRFTSTLDELRRVSPESARRVEQEVGSSEAASADR